MPNAYFQFKQFLVNQDRCAMKVCTDSCVLGAYVEVQQAARILDIGTGTGLLALMLAQRSKATIDAVEIEQQAYEQAQENVAKSPWKDRIRVFHQSIQDFFPPERQPYDLIVCNPPFFHNSLRRKETAVNMALHSTSLLPNDLVKAVSRLLAREGRFAVMLPPYESGELQKLLAVNQLFPEAIVRVYEKEGGRLIRHIATYTYQQGNADVKSFFIRDENGNYTPPFTKLLRPYYLHF